MSLLCQSDVVMFCHISAYSRTSASLFWNTNAVFNGEQEKESIICGKAG